jgi:hypothetical protein
MAELREHTPIGTETISAMSDNVWCGARVAPAGGQSGW